VSMCCMSDCGKEGIVLLNGRALCPQHYLQQVNELNDIGLTPRGVTEAKENMNGSPPIVRRVREPVSEDWPETETRHHPRPF
jgi:hypothetical protein